MPFVPVLVELSPLVIALIALGLAIIATLIIRAITRPLIDAAHNIPYVGGWLGGQVEHMAQALSNALGSAEHGIDKLIGWGWHLLARQWNWFWGEFKRHSIVYGILAALTALSVRAIHALRNRVDGLHLHAGAVSKALARVEREFKGIEHRVRVIEHEIGKGIGHDLRIRVKALEQEVAGIETKTIPAIRSGVAEAESEVTALERWISVNIPLPGTKAFTGAIVAAISLFGFGGLFCNNLKSLLGRRGCGLWSGLDALLNLLIDALALSHLCDLPAWIDEFFSPFLGDLTGLISSAANALCAAPKQGWVYPSVKVADSSLPPGQSVGTFP